MISDENGLLKFSDTEGNESTYNGIDEGIYTLQEIQAPKDYTINEKIYAININPHYDENVQRFIGTDVQVMDTILDEDGNITSYVTKTGKDGEPTMAFVTGTNYDYDAYGKLIQTYTDTQWVSKQNDVYDGKIANLENPDTDQHITTISWDETDTDATKKDISADAIGIVNTKLTRLPSTGGIGTLIYTIGGFAAALAGVFIINKKKDESNS
jgi:LPXTG-motif cell wall-anchored protein